MKKKAMTAIWDDSDESSFKEEEQEVVNLCLMAYEKEVNSEHQLDFTFDEL